MLILKGGQGTEFFIVESWGYNESTILFFLYATVDIMYQNDC